MKFDTNELTIYEVESLHKSLLDEFSEDNLVLDMQNVNRVDMSVIQLFISAQKTAKESSKKFALQNVNEELAQIIKNSACDFLLEENG
ncbi:STAS domain-containing protein [Sulfurimonas sp.]